MYHNEAIFFCAIKILLKLHDIVWIISGTYEGLKPKKQPLITKSVSAYVLVLNTVK